MAKTYGTLQLLDTLRQVDKDNVFTYGEDRLFNEINDVLVAHNEMTDELSGIFVETSTDYMRRFGGQSVSGEMVEVDEYGFADVQKASVAGYNIGFPLRGYQYATN
jgi:hypothetical protein